MERCTLQLVGSYGGWRLIDNGKPSFWFLERDQALSIAHVIADSRAGLRYIRPGSRRRTRKATWNWSPASRNQGTGSRIRERPGGESRPFLCLLP